MGKNSGIEWTHHTFNTHWGCTQVSPGCGLPVKGDEDKPHGSCYAMTFANRVGFSEQGAHFPIWGQNVARRFFGEKHWDEPHKWNKAARLAGVRERVFCGSMCDVMEDRRDIDPPRALLYRLIPQTLALDWLLLTKRPQNYPRLLPDEWMECPPANVWGMTTVEHGDYLWRVDALREVPFAVRGLSCEPLLGPVEFPSLAGIDWVIAGAESGPGARTMNHDWVRLLRDQCAAAGVAFFYKQDAERGQAISMPELDGRTWQEFPRERRA